MYTKSIERFTSNTLNIFLEIFYEDDFPFLRNLLVTTLNFFITESPMTTFFFSNENNKPGSGLFSVEHQFSLEIFFHSSLSLAS